MKNQFVVTKIVKSLFNRYCGFVLIILPLLLGLFAERASAIESDGRRKAEKSVYVKATPGDASLSGLTITESDLSPYTFTPGFSSKIYGYQATFNNPSTSASVTATTNDAAAKLTINGATATSGVPVPITVGIGPNTIAIIVTSHDGTVQQGYLLAVNGPYPVSTLGYNSPPPFYTGYAIPPIVSVGTTALAYTPPMPFRGTTLNHPTGITSDAAGNIYFVDANNLQVKKISSTGGQPTIVASGFIAPYGVAVNSNGDLFVTDQGSPTVTPNLTIIPGAGGQPLIISSIIGTTNSSFVQPTGVTIDPLKNIYVADAGQNIVVKISSDYSTMTKITGFSSPLGLSSDAQGNVYVADFGNNAVQEIPAGTTTPISRATGLDFPMAVTTDKNGNMFIANGGQKGVGTFTSPIGNLSSFVSPALLEYAGPPNLPIPPTVNAVTDYHDPSGSLDLTGNSDASVILNNFFQYCSVNNYRGFIPKGNYLIVHPLMLVGKLYLTFETGAVLERGWDGCPISPDDPTHTPNCSTLNSLIQQDFTAALDGITLNNLTINDTTVAKQVWPGVVLTLDCNDLTINNFNVLAYSGGQAMCIGGNNVTVTSPKIRGGTKAGEGGIRFFGGSRFRCENGDVESGDDCYQFVPFSTSNISLLFNQDISDASYTNCVGKSLAAKFLVVADEENNTAKISNVSFNNMSGYSYSSTVPAVYFVDKSTFPSDVNKFFTSNNGAIMTVPKTSRNFDKFQFGDNIMISSIINPNYNRMITIAGVFVSATTGCTDYSYTSDKGTIPDDLNPNATVTRVDNNNIQNISCSNIDVYDSGSTYNYGAITLSCIKNSYLSTIWVHNTYQSAFNAINNTTNVTLDNFTFDAPKIASATIVNSAGKTITVLSNPILLNTGASNLTISNGKITTNGNDAIVVGQPAVGTDPGSVSNNNLFTGLNVYADNNSYGINLTNGNNNYCLSNTISGASGNNGIRIAPASFGNKIRANDLSGTSVPLNDLGQNTLIEGNLPALVLAPMQNIYGTISELPANQPNPVVIATVLNQVAGIVADPTNNLLLSIDGNNSVKKMTFLPSVFTITPSLPTGLLLNSGTGTISGEPNAINPSTAYTIAATNTAGVASATLSIQVNGLLSNLIANSGTLSPSFSPGTLSYTIIVPNSTGSINVTPTTSIGGPTISINGASVNSGVASADLPLTVGKNSITILVTSPDGTFSQSYTVVVTRISSNANLTSLALNNGTVAPPFDPNNHNYSASVDNSVSTISVIPTTADVTATVTVNGIIVSSGTASPGIPLNVGNNTISTVVTAQDGTTTQTYSVTVTRLSNNANLASLLLSKGTVTPAISVPSPTYSASVNTGVTSITVTPATIDPNATITVNGVSVASNTASAQISLVTGTNNTIVIVVTAQDGVTTKSYTIAVTRALSSNANLFSLKCSCGALTPGPAGTNSYSANANSWITTVTLTPQTVDDNASIQINGTAVADKTVSGPIPIAVGDNIITIAITAQDGITTQTYTLKVTRASGSANSLYQPISVDKPTNIAPIEADGLTVHQALSPNGDGINDFLKIEGISNYPDNSLKIINRDGLVIYEIKGYDNAGKAFDGHSNKTGQSQLPGTYFYSLDYKVKGITRHKTGYIVLKY